jgi:glycosyltransferase involved in cell wall biosynthesis
MRIAMLGVRGLPARGGGAESVVQALAEHLGARGHDVIVYGRKHYVAGVPSWRAGRVIVTAGATGKNFETIIHTATAIWDLLRRNVDVVHIHSPGPALWSWVPLMARKPVVFTVHAPDWRRDKWSRPGRAMLRLGLAVGMRSARAVTAVSRPLADELSDRFGREVVFVPNATDSVEAVAARRIAQWHLRSDGYVLYVGRIEPEKRLELLLRAWRDVLLKETRYKLVVVGDFRANSYGRRCRRMGGAGVVFLGPQWGGALAELYSHAAMVVQPSVLEGMSLVLLEAAAYGRCIVATRIPENEEVLGDAAVYFSRDNGVELADKVCRYLQCQADRHSLGDRARTVVSSGCSWASVADTMEEVYRHVLRQAE